MKPNLTDSMKRGLAWLKEHGGDGCFTSNGHVLAAGDIAPFYRSTWNRLSEAGLIEFYGGKSAGGKGRGRIRLVAEPGQ